MLRRIIQCAIHFFGTTGSKTLIYYVIRTVNISQYVSKYYTLDLIEIISDHMPLYVEIDNHTPVISSTVDACITPRVRALWSGASVDDIRNYKQYVIYIKILYMYQLSHCHVNITTVITHTILIN